MYRIRALGWILAGILLSHSAHAAWQRDYILGRNAFERGDDAEAIRLLEQVIAEKSEPAVSARIQARGTAPYVPQLYLGLALQRSGNCARALPVLQDANLSVVLGSLPAQRALRDAAVQRCTGSAPTAQAEPPTPVLPPPAPPSLPEPAPEPPPPDPWATERASIIALVDAYATQAVISLPAPTAFQSPQARQWTLLLRALQAARQAASAEDGSVAQQRQAGAAAASLAEARALGQLPEWQSLASPRQRRFLN